MATYTVDLATAVSATNFHTIQAAVNAASDNDTITVAAGTWTENLLIDKAVQIVGAKSGLDGTDAGRDASGGLGETTIIGRHDITATGPVNIDGVRFLNDATTTGGAFADPILRIATGSGHVIENAIFWSTVAGGANNDIAILMPPIGAGSITIDDNLFGGTSTGKYGTASWGRGIWSDGGGVELDITGNTFSSTRSAINLDAFDPAKVSVDGNNFALAGTGISIGAPVTNAISGISNNNFGDTDTDLNLNSLTGTITLDLSTAGNTSAGPLLVSYNQTNAVLNLTAGDEDNYIFAAPGNQTIDGAGGSDTYDMASAGSAGSFVDLNSGTAFSTNTGIDTLVSIENVKGSAGADGLYGNAGDNIFIATAGSDVVDGRGGADTFNASAATSAVTANLATGVVSGAFTATLTSIENISTGSGADSITGTSGANVINAGGGNDSVAGGGGADVIDAGSGIDTVTFAGSRDGYTVTWDGTTATVTEISSGTSATVTNAGQLAFGDKDVFLVSATSDYSTIQSAVNAAAATSNTDEVLIAAGDYVEQVVITGSTGITLTGVGEVNIIAPVDVTSTATSSSGRGLNGVVTAVNSSNVVINNIDVDGAGRAATIDGPNPNFVGVVFRNTSGTLNDVDISGVRDAYPGGTTADGFPVVSGNQRGVGLQVDNDTKLAFTMTGGSITDFQKNATVFNGADLNVTGVTITGGGAQTINAQNGFQATNSSGLISGNTITAIGYAGTQVVYSGAMLLYGNTDLNITNNTIVGPNEANADAKVVGIFVLDFGVPSSGGSITGNTISFVDSGIDVSGNITPNGIDISNNTITDLDGNDPYTGGVSFTPSPALTTAFSISGSAEDDYLSGAAGDDVLAGLAGDDVLDGMTGADTMDGGEGDDSFTVDNAADVVTEAAGEGADSVVASVSYELAAGAEVEALSAATGSAAIDLTGNGFAQTITGNAGANVIDGAGGNDTIDGGDGVDTAVISAAADDATVSWDVGTSSFVIASADGTDSLKNVEKVDFDGADVWLVTDAAQLTAALAGAQSGDTIKLAPGEYAGSFSVGVSGITLESVTGVASDVVLEGTFRSANGIADGASIQTWLQTATGYGSGAFDTGLTIGANDVTVNNITIGSYRTAINVGSNTGLTLSGVVLDGFVTGVNKSTQAVVTDFTWTGGEVKDGHHGATFNAAQNDLGDFSGVLIDGVSFSDLNEKGLYFEQLSDADLLNLVMNDVGQFGRVPSLGGLGTFGAGIDINLKYEDYADIEIAGFTFTNVGASNQNGAAASHAFGGAIVVKARDDAGSYDAPDEATLTGVSIHDGTIDGTSTGIRIGEPTKTNAGPSDVTVTDVAITNASVADYDNRTQSELSVTLTDGGDGVSTNPDATGPITITGLGGNDTYTVNGSEQIVEAANGGIDTVQSRGTHVLADNVENLTLLDAGSGTENFENFDIGPITNGENGWTAAGSRDQGVVDLNGNLVFKMSSDPGVPDFAGPYSPVLSVAAGEASTTADGDTHVLKFRVKPVSETADNSRLEVDFGIEAGTDRNNFMVIESVAGQGLRIAVADPLLDGNFDTGAGLNNFAAFTGNRTLVEGLDTSEWHDVELRLTYGDGANDDVIAVYVDGEYVGQTTTFENYRDALGGTHDANADANQTNRIFFRPSASTAPQDGPGGQNQGFYFDDITNTITTAANATGNALDNVITGNAADNVIAGMGGNDTIDGAGGFDTITLTGDRGDYTITWDGTTATVTETATGDVDTITNAGVLSFADKDVILVDDAAGSEYSSIQAAVDAASDGDEILVGAGTYTEQVTVDGFSGLTITAAVPGSVTIEAPDVIAVNGTSNYYGDAVRAVIGVTNSTGVNLTGIVVDGSFAGDTTPGSNGDELSGVAYLLSSGSITGVVIQNVSNSPTGGLFGLQHGSGLFIDGGANPPTLAVSVTNSQISNFQKTGALIVGVDLTFTGNTITGEGAISTTAQNGIQVLHSTGSISGNTIQSFGYTPGGWYSSGIIAYEPGGAFAITDNIITGSAGFSAGLDISDSGGDQFTVNGNTFSLLDYGIYAYSYDGSIGLDPAPLFSGNSFSGIRLEGLHFDAEEVYVGGPFTTVSDVSIAGTNLADVLAGSDGDDTLSGLGGDDLLIARGGVDNIDGGADNDIILYESAADLAAAETVDGGDGDDVLSFASSVAETLVLNATVTNVETVAIAGGTLDGVAMGVDATAASSALTITGNSAANAITGSSFGDTIVAGAGADTIAGGTGDDVLEGGAGADIINGGANTDTASYAASSAGVTVNLFLGTASGGDAAGDTLALIENLTGSANADSLAGDAGANVLTGGGGNDSLTGGDGSDTIIGGDGSEDTVVYSGNWEDYTIERLFGTTYTVSDGVSTDVISGVENFSFADLDFSTDDPDEVTTGGIGGLGLQSVSTEQASTETPLGLEAPDASPNGPYTFTVLALPTSGTAFNGGSPLALNDVLTLAQYQALTYSAPLNASGGFGITFEISDGVDTEEFTVVLGVTPGVNSTLNGTEAGNRLDGAFGDDVLSGFGGNDTLIGGIGNDRLTGGNGVDMLMGGAGNDLYVNTQGDTIMELAGGGTDTVWSATTFSLAGISHVENLSLLGTANLNATGNSAANYLAGNAGDNRFRGGEGADTLAGGAGNDTYIDPTGDSIIEFAGNGTDTVESSRTFSLSGISHVENLTLTGTGNTNATGNSYANVITGNDGNNRLRGAGGADTLIGGLGNDVYINPQGATIVELAGGGNDTVESDQSFDLTTVLNIENLTLTGSADIDATGNASANLITGNSGANRLTSGGGADTLAGGAGNDTYVNPIGLTIQEFSGGGTDTVESLQSFSLQVSAHLENLILTGTGSTSATGNWSDNLLVGNSGNNALRGSLGSDTLDGGAGADRFVFGAIADSTGATRDHILSMNLDEDKFDFAVVPTSIAAAVTTGALNEASFDADLAAAIGGAQLGVGQAVLFTADDGDLAVAGQSFLIVDANGVAGYQAGEDYVVQLANATGTLSLDDFI